MTKTYTQIQQQIEALQREAEKLKRDEIEGVIARIKEAIRVYGLTSRDLGLEGRQQKSAPATQSRPSSSKSKSVRRAKYRDESGNEWVGRGPRPQWLRDALQSGKSLDDFAVGPTSAKAAKSNGAAPKPGARKAKKASRTKYRDDAGHSWSGMGPQPRWLKEAIAGGKKLEDFAA